MSRTHDLAIDADGTRIFVRASSSGIHPLVILTDGVPFTIFGGETVPYVEVKAAIDWHRKERDDTGKEAVPRMIEALERVLAEFEAGHVVEV